MNRHQRVVSNQQLEFTWRNSEQLEGDIALSGSVSVVRQLLAAGLLDEPHLLVHPIAVRNGMRLFGEGETPIPLKLISSETFQTGVLNLVYAPAEPTGDATYEDAKVHLAQPEQECHRPAGRRRPVRRPVRAAPIATGCHRLRSSSRSSRA